MASVTTVVHKKPDVESFTVKLSTEEAQAVASTLEHYGTGLSYKFAKALRQGLDGKTESHKTMESIFGQVYAQAARF